MCLDKIVEKWIRVFIAMRDYWIKIEKRDMDKEWWDEVQYIFKNLDQIQSKAADSFIEFIELEIED